jgi:hypothetical protein
MRECVETSNNRGFVIAVKGCGVAKLNLDLDCCGAKLECGGAGFGMRRSSVPRW